MTLERLKQNGKNTEVPPYCYIIRIITQVLEPVYKMKIRNVCFRKIAGIQTGPDLTT